MNDPIGILIYGYNREDAFRIKSALDPALDDAIFIISASGKEDLLIADILDKGPEDIYEDKADKFIMFLGFNEEKVRTALDVFPSLDVTRPIFCGLTTQNIQWSIKQLGAHLQEEHQQWTHQAPQTSGEA